MKQYNNLSIILPVMDETFSLLETVRTAREHSESDILEFIFVYCDKTRPATLEICRRFQAEDSNRFLLLSQDLPHLGGAIRSAFCIARGSHVLMMSSDLLETDPHSIQYMIEEAKKFPAAIITANRRDEGAGFIGYSRPKLVANALFQKIFKIGYKSNLSDPTFGYRLFPADLVSAYEWEEVRHAFVLETLLRPLKQGVEVREVPSKWVARKEGISHNSFWANLEYFTVLFRGFFYPKI